MQLTKIIKEQSLKYDFPTTVMEELGDYKKKSKKRPETTLLKRIPLHRLMDLKIDYAFKQLFGNEKNKDIMVVFLNAILQETDRNQIKDISFLNIEAGGEYVDDKQSRLDLLVVTNDGESINVEIQFTNKYDMIKRSIYYWSGIYRHPLKKTMGYKELSTVISINILNFSLFDETERFHTTYHLYEDEAKFKLTDVMEFHYIEMTKLIKAWKEEKLDPWNDVLARWLLMLGMVDHRNDKIYEDIFRELEEIAMKDENLKNAFQNWERLSMTQEEYFAYEARLKHILDEESWEYEKKLREQELERMEERVRQSQEELKREQAEAKREQKELEQRKEEAQKIREELEQRKEEAQKKEEATKANIQKAEEKQKLTARKLLSMGMDIEDIVNATELSKEEVIEIQKEL